MSRYSSPHDEPWFSDPDYNNSGHKIHDDKPEPDWDAIRDMQRDDKEFFAADRNRERMEDLMDERQFALDAQGSSPAPGLSKLPTRAQAEARAILAAMNETISLSPLDILFLSQMTDALKELREEETV